MISARPTNQWARGLFMDIYVIAYNFQRLALYPSLYTKDHAGENESGPFKYHIVE